MIYYQDHQCIIRSLMIADINTIVEHETKQGWHPDRKKYLRRLDDEIMGRSIPMVALFHGHVAGYVNVYIKPDWSPFYPEIYPEIVDLGVFEIYRNQGIAHRLLDVAESLAKTYSHRVFLGVGLHQGYGMAQLLYVKRGYLPEGKGLYYHHVLVVPYRSYPIDDDLILYMYKDL